MLKPSGLDADGDHLGAELPECLGRDLVGGAVGAIDHDAHAVEAHLARQRALGELDVAGMRALDPLGAPERGGCGEPLRQIGVEQGLDPFSTSSESLKPSGPKSLMPLSS